MNKRVDTIHSIVNAMIALFNGVITEKEFANALQNSIDEYFDDNSLKTIDDLHFILVKFENYIEHYESINLEWLICQIHSDLNVYVYLPQRKIYEMDSLFKKYFINIKERK